VLAQMSSRSRRYGRIGSVSTPPKPEKKSTGIVRKVVAEYPHLNIREIVYEASSKTERPIRDCSEITLTILARPSVPFLAYGTYSDNQGVKAWFAHKIIKRRTVISALIPASAKNLRLHFSDGVPHDVDFSNLKQKERKLIGKHALIQKQPFMSLGLIPLDPKNFDDGKADPTGGNPYWGGRKSEYNPNVHGAGSHSQKMYSDWIGDPEYWEDDNTSDNKVKMPYTIAGPEFDHPMVPGGTLCSNFMWIKIAELRDGGWKVLNTTNGARTIVAGKTYAIIGAHYYPVNAAGGTWEMAPTKGTDSHVPDVPTIAFFDSNTVANRGEQENTWANDNMVQGYYGGVDGGYYTYNIPGGVLYDLEPNYLKDLVERENLVVNGELTERAKGMGLDMDDVENPTLLDFAVAAEWYNWSEGKWYDGTSRTSRTTSTFDSNGLYCQYFRFPRQLFPKHPDYGKNGDVWKMEKSAWAYPEISSYSKNPDLKFSQVGHKNMAIKGTEHDVELQYRESVQLDIALLDHGLFEADWDGSFHHRKSDYFVMSNHTIKVVDPDSLLYGAHSAIDRVFFADGDFAPGGTVVMIGRGLDKVDNILISKEEFGRGKAIEQTFHDQYWSESGGEINSQPHGFIKTFHSNSRDHIINTNDLIDNTVGPAEQDFQTAFQNIFETPLTTDFFKILASEELVLANGEKVAKLSGSSANTTVEHHLEGREWMYKITDSDGNVGEFPYTIAIFQIHSEYSGPGVETDVTYGERNGVPGQVIGYKVTDRTPDKVWVHFHNLFGVVDAAVEVDLTAEIEYQLEQLKQGLEEIEVLGTKDLTDWDMENHEGLNQGVIESETDDDGSDDDDSSPFGFNFSWPNPFAPFKTDNWVRQNTLIPYGSRDVIEEDDSNV